MDKRQQIIWHIEKAQWMRIVDFTILGPALVLLGITNKKLDPSIRFLLAVTGGLTSAYNLNNFIMQKKFLETYNGEIID